MISLVACVDDRNGMMFNNRRISKDGSVLNDIVEYLDGKKIFMNAYSASMFREYELESYIIELKDFSSVCDGFLFIEDNEYEIQYQYDEVILYKWNRVYPSDISFMFDLTGYKVINRIEIPGHSHEKITREVYRK